MNVDSNKKIRTCIKKETSLTDILSKLQFLESYFYNESISVCSHLDYNNMSEKSINLLSNISRKLQHI